MPFALLGHTVQPHCQPLTFARAQWWRGRAAGMLSCETSVSAANRPTQPRGVGDMPLPSADRAGHREARKIEIRVGNFRINVPKRQVAQYLLLPRAGWT